MPQRTLLGALALLIGVTAAVPASAQFNPEGRKKKKPAATAPSKPRSAPAGSAPSQKPKSKPEGQATEPNAEVLIKRYKPIVLAQPGVQFPLQRLTQLYRERDGNLDKLIEEFEQRVQQGGAERWNALVALAGIYRQAGRTDQAIATYEKAIAEQPQSSVAVLALANLMKDRGNKGEAKKRFEQALPNIKNNADREQVLRTLMELAVELKDFEAAKKHHRALVERAGGSFFVRGELGRALLSHGEHERAVEEYRALVKAAAGDNRALTPALRDLGQALAKAGKNDEALETLRRAMRAAGDQSGMRREIFQIQAEVYRASNRLTELIAELERQRADDFERLKLLAGLYEETGRLDKALETYKRALGKNGKDVDTRIKVVQLLQLQGELDQAIKEYEALIAAAPHNPEFVFQLAEALIQRGDRKKALAHLERLEARAGTDTEMLDALSDFYERVDEKQRARNVLQRLAAAGSADPRHLVELGSRYWEEGDKKKALATWQRIKLVVPDRARALQALGEVYLEHDMLKEALEALRDAHKLKPNERQYRRAYALALERAGSNAPNREARNSQYEEARQIWEQLLRETGTDAHAAREARQHIVTLWSLSDQLNQRIVPLERQLNAKPPDLEAGRLLAEAQLRLSRHSDAERTLRRIVQHAPGDSESMLRLERALVQQRKLREAIEVLKKLTSADAKNARKYYQRMAEYAGDLYLDDEAVAYAARGVELSPDDADGFKKLGEMYLQRQETDKAIDAFRKAISKNDRLFTVYFQLADLLKNQERIEEADRLLRRVVRASPDEELVQQAAYQSIQLNQTRGTLESLERELFAIALGSPQKPIYRRLLVEVYNALAFPLVHQSKSADAAQAAKAKRELRAVGERAVKPLLDALADERNQQQPIALELLAHIENKGAGPALFTYATGAGDPPLRARAMIAVGALKDAELLPKLEALLIADGRARSDESDPVIVAAAWSVAYMQSPRARPLLERLLESEAPSIRATAALGLGMLGDRRSAPRLSEVAAAVDAGPIPRAAAAHALGQLGAERDSEIFAQLSESSDPLLRATAIVALSRLRSPAAKNAIAQALVDPNPALQSAAAGAALVMATGDYRSARAGLSIPEARVDVRALIERLHPSGYTPDEHAAALVALAPEIRRQAVAAVQSGPERARAVANALLARGGSHAFGPLTLRLAEAKAATRKAAEQAIESIASAVVEPFTVLARHPSSQVRANAIEFLATRSEPSAQAALTAALDDQDERVQSAALVGVGRQRSSQAAQAITELLSQSQQWPVRMRAARALGKLGTKARADPTLTALTQSAQHDPYALVREAAMHSLNEIDPAAARRVLTRAAEADPEPRLRKIARDLLQPR